MHAIIPYPKTIKSDISAQDLVSRVLQQAEIKMCTELGAYFEP